MIKHQLAKELFDAGFPQLKNGKGTWWNYVVSSHNGNRQDFWQEASGHWDSKDATYYYVPTLEELISECGTGFAELSRGNSPVDNAWTAHGLPIDISNVGSGESPKEAVAKLFIKINTKS